MIRVISIQDGGLLVVDASDYRRIVIQPGDVVQGELVPMTEADAYVLAFNSYHPKRDHWAESISYADHFVSN